MHINHLTGVSPSVTKLIRNDSAPVNNVTEAVHYLFMKGDGGDVILFSRISLLEINNDEGVLNVQIDDERGSYQSRVHLSNNEEFHQDSLDDHIPLESGLSSATSDKN